MSTDHITDADRLAIRERPNGRPIMYQKWGKLLFMHWRLDEKMLRPLIPSQLEIDTFDGSAWIGVVPFTMWGIRASFLPAIPGTSAFHELNVRTYVRHRGVPSVWFLSLDAANRLAVWGARTFYHLPYFNAQMSLNQTGNTISYSSVRKDRRGAPAELEATWNIGETLPPTSPGSLEFFLTERYCLDTEHRGKLYRARIHHRPWPLKQAELASLNSSMIESHGLPTLEGDPLLYYCEELSVDIWPLKRIQVTDAI
ncbi:MAG: YqjF family protein [Pyrinomonadaceae bacterium]